MAWPTASSCLHGEELIAVSSDSEQEAIQDKVGPKALESQTRHSEDRGSTRACSKQQSKRVIFTLSAQEGLPRPLKEHNICEGLVPGTLTRCPESSEDEEGATVAAACGLAALRGGQASVMCSPNQYMQCGAYFESLQVCHNPEPPPSSRENKPWKRL
eukprot:3612509-Amphidinium_carterae.1